MPVLYMITILIFFTSIAYLQACLFCPLIIVLLQKCCRRKVRYDDPAKVHLCPLTFRSRPQVRGRGEAGVPVDPAQRADGAGRAGWPHQHHLQGL